MDGTKPPPPSPIPWHGQGQLPFLLTTFSYYSIDRDTDPVFAVERSKILSILCQSPNPHIIDVSDFVTKYSTGQRITLLVHTSARSFRDFQPRDAMLTTTTHSLT